MTKDRSYGVVPLYLDDNNQYRYLIVKQSQTHWSFPKGHAEAGETPMDAAYRELAEETGIRDVSIKTRPRFPITYYFKKGRDTVKKTVDHFLGFVNKPSVTPQEKEVIDWQWATFDEAYELLYRNTADRVLTRVDRYLKKKRRSGKHQPSTARDHRADHDTL